MKLPEPGAGETPDHPSVTRPAAVNLLAPRCKVLIVTLVFFIALGVRLINWQSHHDEALTVQTGVALNYKHQARLLRTNGVASLYDASSPTNNPDLLGHPPGYPILLSVLYRVSGEQDTVTQFLQIILDSLSVVIIVLIAFEFFPAAIGVIAGLMAALAPQFSWNSLTLLPDSLATLPILVAMLIIVKTRQATKVSGRSELLSILIAGALIGISVWLRPNALLLAPFLAFFLLFIYKRGARLRLALILVCGALLIVIPLTIRNFLVFGELIPVSLGAGQTLIEGIADYNTDGTLGLPQTDMELIRGEAETFHRPEYANSLFTPDGPARDRARLVRGFSVVRAHPFWFFGVMVRRSASMLRLERTPLRLTTTKTGTWQSLFQWPLRIVQKLFITAILLPLVLLGTGILIYRRQVQSLAILLVVPGYYFSTQSALHTEYRYVLVIHCFLFVLAAVGVYSIICQMNRKLTRLKPA